MLPIYFYQCYTEIRKAYVGSYINKNINLTNNFFSVFIKKNLIKFQD